MRHHTVTTTLAAPRDDVFAYLPPSLFRTVPRCRLSEVRPSYGSILVPLFEEDGLRMGELARRARLSNRHDHDGAPARTRAARAPRARPRRRARVSIVLTAKARRFEPVAERTLAELAALARDRLGERGSLLSSRD